MGTVATTASGSRTFAGSFEVKWVPSSTSAALTVTITAGGSLLTNNTFTPDDATQVVSGSNETYQVQGTIIAGFNTSGTSGTLLAQGLQFTAPTTGKQTFSGTIGLW